MKIHKKRTVLALSLLLSLLQGGLYAADAFTPEEAADHLALLTLKQARALVLAEQEKRSKEEPGQLTNNLKRFVKKMKDISEDNKASLLNEIVTGCLLKSSSEQAQQEEKEQGAFLTKAARAQARRLRESQEDSLKELVLDSPVSYKGKDYTKVLFPYPYALEINEDTHYVGQFTSRVLKSGESAFVGPLSPCLLVVASHSKMEKVYVAHFDTFKNDASTLVSALDKFFGDNKKSVDKDVLMFSQLSGVTAACVRSGDEHRAQVKVIENILTNNGYESETLIFSQEGFTGQDIVHMLMMYYEGRYHDALNCVLVTVKKDEYGYYPHLESASFYDECCRRNLIKPGVVESMKQYFLFRRDFMNDHQGKVYAEQRSREEEQVLSQQVVQNKIPLKELTGDKMKLSAALFKEAGLVPKK